MADLIQIGPGETDLGKIVAALRAVIERFPAAEDLASASEGALIAANNLSDLANVATARSNLAVVAKAGDTMTGPLEIDAGTATTQIEYLKLKPTDFAAGKPYIAIKKETTANKWTILLWDGSSTGGTIDIAVTSLTHNSQTVWDAVSLPQFASGAAGYVPASGGGTANFLRADASWAAPPSGGLTVLSYAGAVGTGTTYSVTGLGGYKMLLVNLRDVSHNSGSNQSFRCAVSGNGGSSYGTALSPNGSQVYGAAVGLSGMFFVTNTDQTNNQTVTIGLFGGSPIDSSTRGPIDALQFSFSGGNFDNGSIDIYGLK